MLLSRSKARIDWSCPSDRVGYWSIWCSVWHNGPTSVLQMFVLVLVDRQFDLWSGQYKKNYKTGICCFSATLRNKSKDCLVRSMDNVSEWSDVSICGLLFLWTIMLVKRVCLIQEEFEDTKGVIKIRKSKKDRQHNGQKKKDKRTKNDLQNVHIKLKIE